MSQTTLNLTAELERLIADIVVRHEAFSHIDPSRLLVCVNATRSGTSHGLFARIHPLRFPGGRAVQTVRRGRSTLRCTMPALVHQGVEILYVIYFMIPRFLDRPLQDKLVTIFHELYHISPQFDGDIRRFPGRNFAHGSSTKKYNRLMERFVDEYVQLSASNGLTAFLDHGLAALREKHTAVVGRKMIMPKIQIERV
jgi:predicted metallopeptidase